MPAKGYKMNYRTVTLTDKQWCTVTYLAWEYMQLMGQGAHQSPSGRKWVKEVSGALRSLERKLKKERKKNSGENKTPLNHP